MKPSEVMLRSETNWTSSSFPLVMTTLRKESAKAGEQSEELGPEVFQGLDVFFLPWCSVPAELPNPPRVVSLTTVKQRHIIIATVRVGLQVQLYKLHFDHLDKQTTDAKQKSMSGE